MKILWQRLKRWQIFSGYSYTRIFLSACQCFINVWIAQSAQSLYWYLSPSLGILIDSNTHLLLLLYCTWSFSCLLPPLGYWAENLSYGQAQFLWFLFPDRKYKNVLQCCEHFWYLLWKGNSNVMFVKQLKSIIFHDAKNIKHRIYGVCMIFCISKASYIPVHSHDSNNQ